MRILWEIWEDMKNQEKIYGVFLSHGGTASSHPFYFWIFYEINHPAIGIALFLETTIVDIYFCDGAINVEFPGDTTPNIGDIQI